MQGHFSCFFVVYYTDFFKISFFKYTNSFRTTGTYEFIIPVSSDVPQGSVLRPILFPAYINDLPEQVRSRVRLFGEDTALYLCISNLSEANTLQEDLCKLDLWEEAWDMNFNPTKCQVSHVTRLKTLIPSKYFPHRIELKSVSAAKYQGVTILDDLSWGTNIANIAKKTNQSLGFLKRNIKLHKQELKSTAYKTLIQTQLEYASTVWSPHTAKDTNKIKSVQLRATWWTCHDYRQTSSVTKMLENLHWRPLDQSLRIDSRLVIMYKVTYDLVAIPASEYLIPNGRESKFIYPLPYKQIIPTSSNYYKYSFSPRTIIHWNALPTCIVLLPTLAQFSHAVCQVVHVSP